MGTPVKRDKKHIPVTLFGYGITTTPLQLARAYSAFATGGLQRPVSLLALEGDHTPEITLVEEYRNESRIIR